MKKYKFKIMDIVKTPKGKLGLVTIQYHGDYCLKSIDPTNPIEYSAWYSESELIYVNSFNKILKEAMKGNCNE